MIISEKDLYQTLHHVCDYLRSFEDIDTEDHKILQSDLQSFTHQVFEYIQDDYAKIKSEIQARYSKERIYEFVELLKHNRNYIQLRYSICDFVDEEKMICDLTELLQRFFENDVLNINEDFYYIIFDNFPEICTWMKRYCYHYAIIVSYIIFGKM